MGIAVSCGCGTEMGAEGTRAELGRAGADETASGTEVVAAVVGTTAAEEAPEPDMADTRLLERVLLRREYECEMAGRGLNPRRRTSGAVFGAKS